MGIGRDIISPMLWRACPAHAPVTAVCSLELRDAVPENTLHRALWCPAHPALWSLPLLWLNFLHRHSCRPPPITTNLKALRIRGP